MLRLLFDEDVSHHVIRGLVRRLPRLSYETTLSLGLSGESDMEVLRAAAREARLLVSHDVNTMSAAFSRLLEAGEPTWGLLLAPQSLPIGETVEDLELVCSVTSADDWIGVIDYLPI